jgi:hypothetical protein
MTTLTFTEITPSMIGDRNHFLLMYSACRYLMNEEKTQEMGTTARAEILWAASLLMQCAMETARRAA